MIHPTWSQEERERLEEFAERFERNLRAALDAAETEEDMEKVMDEADRMIAEYGRKLEEREKQN
jgi:hypothetical protein